ncbi:hypothetical protein ACLI4Q_18775 [Natrialbaceae archaeon A-CW1-1]
MIEKTPASEQTTSEQDPETDYSTSEGRSDTSFIGRRSALKLLGVAAVPLAAQTGAAEQTDGYGASGYGSNGYGGESSKQDESADDEEESADDDESDEQDKSTLTVQTRVATDVTSSSATLNGELVDDGGLDTVDVYFTWQEAGTGSWHWAGFQRLSSSGSFSVEIDGLASGTDYEFRAITGSGGGTQSGSILEFQTDEQDESTLTVQTRAATNVTGSSATLNGEIIDDGGLDTVDVYFTWQEAGTGSWHWAGFQRLNSSDSFCVEIDGLSSDTAYEFRAIAGGGGGTLSGSILEFQTD